MTVIGLTGLAGSGKSTVAKYLVENHGFTLLSFAGPLKKMLRTLDPYMVESPVSGFGDNTPLRLSDLLSVMDENELKKSSAGAEYRRLLQSLGTDCVRAVEPDFWVNAAVAQMTEPKGRYVFDDVRFPNEAEVITTFNPSGLWNIQRPGQELVGGEHISEKHAGYMNESAYIINDDFIGLYRQIEFQFASTHLKNYEVSNSDSFYSCLCVPNNIVLGCSIHDHEHLFVNAIEAMKNFQKSPGGQYGEERSL